MNVFDMVLAIGLIVAMFVLIVLLCLDVALEARDERTKGGRIYPPKDQGRPW